MAGYHIFNNKQRLQALNASVQNNPNLTATSIFPIYESADGTEFAIPDLDDVKAEMGRHVSNPGDLAWLRHGGAIRHEATLPASFDHPWPQDYTPRPGDRNLKMIF